MKVVDLIAALPTKHYQAPVFFKVGNISYPVVSVTTEEISTGRVTLVILSPESAKV